jgi:hypothetical protein
MTYAELDAALEDILQEIPFADLCQRLGLVLDARASVWPVHSPGWETWHTRANALHKLAAKAGKGEFS